MPRSDGQKKRQQTGTSHRPALEDKGHKSYR